MYHPQIVLECSMSLLTGTSSTLLPDVVCQTAVQCSAGLPDGGIAEDAEFLKSPL
jgi:hypothetical protein